MKENLIQTFSYQDSAVEPLLNGIKSKIGKLLIAPTRTGKTYAIAKALKKAQDEGIIPYNKQANKLCSILFLTKKSIKIQSTRVLKELGVEDCWVEAYDSIRSSFGELWIDWIKGLEYGVLTEKPVWRTQDMPDIIIADECQYIKNVNAQCSAVIKSFIEQGGVVIFSSATPFVTIEEARLICYGCRVANDLNWSSFCQRFCGTKGPTEISPANSERLTTYLENTLSIVRFSDIKYQHKTINKCRLIDFENNTQRLLFERAYDDYKEQLRKLNRGEPGGVAAIWVAMLKFRQRAELLRARRLARIGKEIRYDYNRQVIIASNFIETLRLVWDELVKKQNILPEKVSFIIGQQDLIDRQRCIDRFQKGIADFCLFTLKAGGVGISLHHCIKEALPRHVILPPTWSAVELVQALGRAHGPGSLSTTHQDVVWFKNTIEERVAEKVSSKMSCLAETVRRRESWVDLFNKISEQEKNEIETKIEEETKDNNFLFPLEIL